MLETDLPKHGAKINLAGIALDRVQPWTTTSTSGEYVFATDYYDTEVDGLRFSSAAPKWNGTTGAKWHFTFERGVVNLWYPLGAFPEVSLGEARDKARHHIARLEAQLVAPTNEECLAYDAARGGTDEAEILRGFCRVAQVPQEMQDSVTLPAQKLPCSEILRTSVTALSLSTRSASVLANEGIKTIANLLLYSDAQLLRLPNFGRKSLAEVRTALATELRLDKSPQANSIGVCQWCGLDHRYVRCHLVRALEFYPDGKVKRVEFWTEDEIHNHKDEVIRAGF